MSNAQQIRGFRAWRLPRLSRLPMIAGMVVALVMSALVAKAASVIAGVVLIT